MNSNAKTDDESRFKKSNTRNINQFFFLIYCFLINYSFVVGGVITAVNNGKWSNPATWNLNRIPATNDSVVITGDFEIEADIDTTCYGVTILAPVSLNFSGLTILNGIHLKIKKSLSILGGNGNNKKTKFIFVGNSQVSVGKDLIITSNEKQNASVDMSAGSSRLNIGNNFLLNGKADWVSGSSSIISFNGSVSQTFPASYGLKFANLHLNNISADGVKTDADITNQIVTETILVQSGIFDNAGYAISGIGNTQGDGVIKIFEVVDFAKFVLKGSSNFPTGFNTIILGTKSTVQYDGNGQQTIRSLNYGNLESSNTGNRTLDISGDIGVAGYFNPGSNSFVITNSTVNYNGASPQIISAFNYYNLTSSNTGSRIITSSGKVRIANIFTPGNNPYAITNSTIEFNGTIPQTIPSFNYFNLNSTSSGVRVLDNTGSIYIKGNFNIGSNTYQSVNSSLILDGTVSQNITGSAALIIKNFTINNSSGVILRIPLKINGNLQFTNGIIYNDSSSIITFDSLASASGASSLSFINGPVTCVTNRAKSYNFPIGKNNIYLPVIITTILQGNGVFTAEYFNQIFTNTSSFSADLSRVSNLEYFSIKKTGTAEAKVTLNWNLGSLVDGSAINDLRVVSWNGSVWQNAGNTFVSGTGSAGNITSASQSSFNFFTLGSLGSNNPLPVELLFFDASSGLNTVELFWATASENNSSYFNLEKSTDQLIFSSIGKINSQGTSSEYTHYKFIDTDPIETDAYYRLSQIDLDGTVEFFPIKHVKKSNQNELYIKQVYPNPIHNGSTTSLKIITSKGTSIDIRLLDLNGNMIYTERFESIYGGEKKIDLKILDLLSNGFYILQVTDSYKSINHILTKI